LPLKQQIILIFITVNPRCFVGMRPIPNDVVNEMIQEGSFDLYIELNMLRISGILMDESRKLENKIPPKFNLVWKSKY
jgi:hypothetical protein